MESSSTVTYDTVVHKANLPLAKNESLGQFTRNLNDAARKALALKLNLTTKNCSTYMIETFADSAVFDVYKRSMVDGEPGTYNYYAMKFTRKADGTFEFGETVEVERVTSFEPKSSMSVTKAAGDEESDMEDEEPEELAKNPKKKTKKGAPPGWATTTKSLWNNVL